MAQNSELLYHNLVCTHNFVPMRPPVTCLLYYNTDKPSGMTGPWSPHSFSANTLAGPGHTRGEGWFTVWIASSSVRHPPRDANICDAQMMYWQAGRLTDASWPSFCASEYLTDKVGNPVEAGLTVWKDLTLLGRSKVFRACIDMHLCYYF